MAISELISGSGSHTPSLFTRLPGRLFAPLASPNKERYWAILCVLYENRFGPEAPLPPSKGYTFREIVADIESALLHQDAWGEEGDDPETPIGIRANMVMTRLVEAGWLKLERRALTRTVFMRPVVSHFLTQLVYFAERGPVFVSGKINVIEASLKEVVQGEKLGDVLGEVAQQSRDLLEHIRNTGNIIRELMETLDLEMTTAQYVRTFFANYIEQVFIGDYREMRTKEHPLARRQQILRMTDAIDESTEIRSRLIDWYAQYRATGDVHRAERLYERDMQRLRDLIRIDEYIARLDDEIRRANRKAYVYLDHRLRSVDFLDAKIRHAIDSVLASSEMLWDPFGAGDMINANRLAEPRKVSAKHSTSALRSVTLSPRDLARNRVLQRARAARSMNPHKLSTFVLTRLETEGSQSGLDSSDIKLDSAEDIRAYQALLAASMGMASDRARVRLLARQMTRGFTVTPTGEPDEPHPYITGRPFKLTKNQKRKEDK
ncbi:Wadjet anti-phage system protein JetA family protein [Herminiimonas sp. NPDC097707]|uniref:Wadjet anti-phage system protein JetA family protein n=1 Tax=Herminiimonas sp. NPDC097707 TaxID=3364007 RepID=UPI00383B6DD8